MCGFSSYILELLNVYNVCQAARQQHTRFCHTIYSSLHLTLVQHATLLCKSGYIRHSYSAL